jgi:hypothetical protein
VQRNEKVALIVKAPSPEVTRNKSKRKTERAADAQGS